MTEKFKKLNDYQHARLRTEMYLGSREEHTQGVVHFDGEHLRLREFTWVPAMYTALRELIDNALDEMIGHGHGNTLKVNYNPETMEFSVEDNGRGLPITEKKELGKGPAAPILLGEARAGRNFDERQQVAGTNGLGAACTNFTSEWFQLDVWRGGKHLRQRWQEPKRSEGVKPSTTGHSLTRGAKGKRGTLIRYVPSSKVFPHRTLPLEFVKGRMWDIAVANPKLRVFFNGQRLLTGNTKDPIASTYFKNRSIGKIDFADENFSSRFYLVPSFEEPDSGVVVHSMVNNLPAIQGGTHIEEFNELFFPPAIRFLKGKTKEKLNVRREDIAAGLLVFNVTEMHNPHFNSQTKERLISGVGSFMKRGFDPFWVESVFRRNPDWAEQILNRCRDRAALNDLKEVNKTQRKLAGAKVAALEDANSKDRSKCILFIAEGDSAIEGMSEVRDPEVHGRIKLTGKIMNVHDLTPKKVLSNKVLADIMSSVGLRIGEKAKLEDLRYGSVFIAADEDEDGKNITALLVNFFYKFWPELFKQPFVFKFCTPFIILRKGKQNKYIYAHDYQEFQENLSKWKGWSITRAKGLGTLEVEDWEHALTKPVVVPILDDGKLGATLDLIFNGTRADDRKEWLRK